MQDKWEQLFRIGRANGDYVVVNNSTGHILIVTNNYDAAEHMAKKEFERIEKEVEQTLLEKEEKV